MVRVFFLFGAAFILSAAVGVTEGAEPIEKSPAEKSLGEKSPPVGKPAPGVKVPAGFTATLFAEPPNVNYPTCISATPDGIVYVGCDENGSLDAKPGRGRIVRCVDKDGDGVADEFSIFAKVDSPRGVIADGNAVYVIHPPKLSKFVDTKGDGVADKEEVLVEGIGRDLKFRGADHTMQNMRLGIDGYIYMAAGDYGFAKAVGKDGTQLQLRGGGVVRVRTDGTGLEIVARGTRNIFDIAVDPWLNIFARDNNNDGGGWDVRLSHLVQGANYGYPRLYQNFADEMAQPMVIYGPGAPTGALYADEPALPSPYARTLYTVDWGMNAVYRHPLTAKGASFTVQQEKFVELPKPTDMDIDAAGRMYFASWVGAMYNNAGPKVGFIARVTANDAKPPVVPDIAKLEDAALVKIIGGGSHVLRLAAQRELLRHKDWTGDVVEGLQKIVDQPGDTAPRVAALYTLSQRIGANAGFDIFGCLKKPELREFALRALGEYDDTWSNPDAARKEFVAALSDVNPRVRIQAVNAIVRRKYNDKASALVPLVADDDPLIAHVTRNGLAELKATADLLAGYDRGPAKISEGCLQSLQMIHDPAAVDGLIERLGKTTDSERRKLVLSALCRLCMCEAEWDGVFWWGYRPDATGPYFKPAAWEKTTQIQETVLRAFEHGEPSLRPWLLKEVRRNRIELPNVQDEVLKLIAADPAFRAEGAQILAELSSWNDAALELIVAVAADHEQEPKIREDLIQHLMKRTNSAAAKQAALKAVAAIGSTDNREGFRQLRNDFLNAALNGGQWKSFVEAAEKGSPTERELAYIGLVKVSQQEKGSAEGKGAASKLLDAAWIKPETTVELLRAIGVAGGDGFAYQVTLHRKDADEAIRKAAEFAATELHLDEVDKNKVTIATLKYEDVVAEVERTKGDAKLGAKLFLRAGCTNCHSTSPTEQPKGPFLGGIGTRFKRPELCESILKPSAKIAAGFQTQVFALSDGRVVEGFITKESATELEIRGQNGAPLTIVKSTIEQQKKSDRSMMPEGLVDKFSTAELAALIAYLESLPPGSAK